MWSLNSILKPDFIVNKNDYRKTIISINILPIHVSGDPNGVTQKDKPFIVNVFCHVAFKTAWHGHYCNTWKHSFTDKVLFSATKDGNGHVGNNRTICV